VACAEIEHPAIGGGATEGGAGKGMLVGEEDEGLRGNRVGHGSDNMEATLGSQSLEVGIPVQIGIGGDEDKI